MTRLSQLYTQLTETLNVVADVRLDIDTTTQVKLTGLAGTGKIITVNGSNVDCSTAKTCAKTANLITSAGADAGSVMSVSTFYYGYVSNSIATYAPSSLRFSTTAPTDGYLGTSGNAANWRYIGDVYLESDGNFKDSDTQRMVRSEFNVIWKSLRAYNTTGSWTPGIGWREFNGGTGQTRGYFLGDAKSSILMSLWQWATAGGGDVRSGIGYDTTTNVTNDDMLDLWASNGLTVAMSSHVNAPARARHYLTMLEHQASGSSTYYGLQGGYNACGLKTLIPC
jgi:hypothetical protein